MLPRAPSGIRHKSNVVVDANNPAWRPTIAGFEVQVDDTAAGDPNKDFYGIKPEPPAKYKNRTGAI